MNSPRDETHPGSHVNTALGINVLVQFLKKKCFSSATLYAGKCAVSLTLSGKYLLLLCG